jgi:hypothetical protein
VWSGFTAHGPVQTQKPTKLVAEVAAVAGSRDWWRSWRLVAGRVGGMVATVARSRDRWLEVAEVAGATRLIRLIPQIGGEPTFDVGDLHFLPFGVVGHLVFGDPVYGEIARLGVTKVEATDGGGGPHGEGFS